MLLTLNADATICVLPQKSKLCISIFQLSCFGEPVPIAVLDFCPCLIGVEPAESGYLSNHTLSVTSSQSRYSPLTSLINNTFLFTELLLTGCSWHSFEEMLETVVRENPSTEITFFLHSEASDLFLCAFIHCTAAT